MKLKTLHLRLLPKWFDATLKGIKNLEYRDATPYYASQLLMGAKGEPKSSKDFEGEGLALSLIFGDEKISVREAVKRGILVRSFDRVIEHRSGGKETAEYVCKKMRLAQCPNGNAAPKEMFVLTLERVGGEPKKK